ncbi:POTRA domain-containing protein, partial [Paraburkholderia aspalathi]|uniref:POTRA domain-containing protein n=1 Tax=Paraburkholderia aspalathi TaxID=1324617 RepID=UPI003558B197
IRIAPTTIVSSLNHATRSEKPPENPSVEATTSLKNSATVAAPVVRSAAPLAGEWPVLPVETPCFRIDTFSVEVPDTLPEVDRLKGASALPMDPFAFLRDWLRHYEGQCVGKQGIDMLTRGLQGVILSRGYITTRVLLPAQDLSKGTMKFTLIPGVIRNLKFADENTRGTWKTAFPARDGDVLQLRDLEQGLEQMKRVPNQDATMEIVPGTVPGESDVVITTKRTKPWSLVVSADNSGTDETGRYIGNVTLGLYNLLGLNDVLSGGFNSTCLFATSCTTLCIRMHSGDYCDERSTDARLHLPFPGNESDDQQHARERESPHRIDERSRPPAPDQAVRHGRLQDCVHRLQDERLRAEGKLLANRSRRHPKRRSGGKPPRAARFQSWRGGDATRRREQSSCPLHR